MSDDPNSVTAGVAAGIVICSLLFLIVLALIAYNIYLWRRRKATKGSAKAINKRYTSSWRPNDVLYTKPNKGNGNVNAAFAPSTATGSMATLSSRGVGPAPRAQNEDISDDEADDSGMGRQTYSKPRRPPLRDQRMEQTHAPPPDYQTALCPQPQSVAVPSRPEVTLEPQQLQAQWDRIWSDGCQKVAPPSAPPVTYRASTADAVQTPNGHRDQATEQRNSCLAVLSVDPGRIRNSADVSLTGFGAQYVPDIGNTSPAGLVGNGRLSYHAY